MDQATGVNMISELKLNEKEARPLSQIVWEEFDHLLEIIMKSKPVFWYFLLPVGCKEETLANNVQVMFLMGSQVVQKKK